MDTEKPVVRSIFGKHRCCRDLFDSAKQAAEVRQWLDHRQLEMMRNGRLRMAQWWGFDVDSEPSLDEISSSFPLHLDPARMVMECGVRMRKVARVDGSSGYEANRIDEEATEKAPMLEKPCSIEASPRVPVPKPRVVREQTSLLAFTRVVRKPSLKLEGSGKRKALDSDDASPVSSPVPKPLIISKKKK